MSGKGKRRSARLLKLEEQKNDDGGPTVCLLDPWQIIRNSIAGARGKRKRNDEIQKLQGEASCSQAIGEAYDDNPSRNSSTGQIIECILDTLELRDRHELFAMPDDIQVSDYAERINRPGDFATLRQKNTDGMYKTLEQFENDVYMVFQKAMSINSNDTIPYREAMSLLDQAKQVFMSLKSNQMYSEPELTAWRQKHLDVGACKPATEEDGGDAAATAAPQRPSAPAKKKAGAVAAEKRQQGAGRASNISADNGRARQRGAKEGKSTPGKRARKAPATVEAVRSGGARVEKRRLTYTGEAGRGRGTTAMTMPAFQDRHATLLYQPQVQGHTYEDSLRRFVRHAGLKARVAAEFRTLECDTRARRQNQAPAYWNGFAPGAGAGTSTGAASSFLPHGSQYPPSPPNADAAAAAATSFQQTPSPSGGRAVGDEQAPLQECKLETDELLRLVMLMGTPAFFERAKQVFGGDTPGEESSKEERQTGDGDDARVGVTSAVSGQKSGASEPASAFGPFAPPKLVPGRLGFCQFAGSSTRPFKATPSTSKSRGKKKCE